MLHYKDADEDANTKKKQTTVESDNLVDRLGFLKKIAINEIEAYEKKENKIYSQKKIKVKYYLFILFLIINLYCNL